MATLRTILLGIILIFLVSCKKDAETEIKDYPIIETLEVSNINEKGATFNAEFINLGNENVKEFGFVYGADEPSFNQYDTILLDSQPEKGKYNQMINGGLAGNIEYLVKSYVKTSKYTIFGNVKKFFSLGSQLNPWRLDLTAYIDGWHDCIGMSNDEHGFILFNSGHLYAFNPNSNTMKEMERLVLDKTRYNYFASFNLGNFFYILTNSSENIFRYDIDADHWDELGKRPFSPDGNLGFYGFTIDGTGYFLSGNAFYAYNPDTDTWSSRANIMTTYIYLAETVGKKAIAIGKNQQVFMFDPDVNMWTEKKQYPGKWNGKIIGFSVQDKIYCGLSYTGAYIGAPLPEKEFWSYHPESNDWQEVQSFPLYHSQNETFTFSIGDRAYFGFNSPSQYPKPFDHLIFSFSPKE
jgi:N-acetylneuraminic acid mutarotase